MPEIQENFLKGIVTSPSEYHVDEISVKIIIKKNFNWRCSQNNCAYNNKNAKMFDLL